MAVTFLGQSEFPAYIAKSTDIASTSGSVTITSGSIIGTPSIGRTIYTTDTQKWYIVVEASGSSYYIESFKMPSLEV